MRVGDSMLFACPRGQEMETRGADRVTLVCGVDGDVLMEAGPGRWLEEESMEWEKCIERE